MFLTGEELFCDMIELQYDAFIALIDAAINFPRMALQIVKSVIQAATFLVFEVVRSGLIIAEQEIIKYLNIDGIDLSKTKDGFCQVAWECAAIRDKLFNLINVSDSVKTNYQEFEDIICKQGLRSLLENWVQENLLDTLDKTLQNWIDDIQRVFDEIDNEIQKYIDWLLTSEILGTGKSFQEWMEELDKYADCAFGLCNWALTSSNKKEDLLHDAGVKQTGSGFVMVLNEYNEFLSEKETLEEWIRSLQTKIQEGTPKRGSANQGGFSPDDIAR